MLRAEPAAREWRSAHGFVTWMARYAEEHSPLAAATAPVLRLVADALTLADLPAFVGAIGLLSAYVVAPTPAPMRRLRELTAWYRCAALAGVRYELDVRVAVDDRAAKVWEQIAWVLRAQGACEAAAVFEIEAAALREHLGIDDAPPESHR